MSSILKKPGEAACFRLGQLQPGDTGRLCTEHAANVSPRLRDLGFVGETWLEVLREAPLGDPIEVEIRGTRLCLRRADVADVCVRKNTDPA